MYLWRATWRGLSAGGGEEDPENGGEGSPVPLSTHTSWTCLQIQTDLGDGKWYQSDPRDSRLVKLSDFFFPNTAFLQFLARYQLVVTQRKEAEPHSSSIYYQNDMRTPTMVFADFINNETLLGEVGRFRDNGRKPSLPDVLAVQPLSNTGYPY